jgi:DNA-binding HxlR family transcriptional regulator
MKEEKGSINYNSIMSREGVSGILRYLHDHGEAKNVDLKTVIGNHYRLHDTMTALEQAGLVKTEYQTTPKRIYRYWLTAKGKAVSRRLMEIERILKT